MTRTTRLFTLAAAAALAVAACGGSASTAAPIDAPEVSVAPASVAPAASEAAPSEAAASAPAAGPDVNAAAAALDDIQRYAVEMKASGIAQVAAGAGEITMSGLIDREQEASQFEMTGVAGLEAVGGGSGISFIVIGDQAWISTDGENFITTPGGAAMFEPLQEGLGPATLLNSVPAATLQGMTQVGQEEKNGMATTHYHATGAESPSVAEGLGADGVVDVWVADEHGYLVSMAVDGVVDVNGVDTPITWSVDISRINDESIAIEAPN